MASVRIELGDADFAVAVPFGFVADPTGRIEVVGNALQRVLGLHAGAHVREAFKVLRPVRTECFSELPADPRTTIVLRDVDGRLELRGNNLPVGGERVAFVGSPVVRDIEDFQRRGLHLSDFAPCDATPDLLLSMQATRSALDDARKLSADLKVALVNAETAMEAKARFLAMMSHEIRTPLNGFGSMIDLLRDSPLTAEQRDNLETMDLCARSLLVLVNDILEFSKLEAGKIELAPRPVSPARAITLIVGHFRAAARERGVELVLRNDCPDSQWVRVDVERVRQVLVNLIGNALKFTHNGRIVVHVHAPADDRLTIDVQDTGPGIPADSLPRLFEPFVQADNSATRRFGGTGLGLTISRQLAQALGGNVELVQTSSEGSWFRFSCAAPGCAPAHANPRPRATGDVTSGFANASVLVVDDDGTNQLIAQKLLRKLGVEPTVVGDGEAAVEVTRSRRFDLILMDMMMPRLDGIEATQQIRSGGGPCRDVPILAFSAAAFDADRTAAAAAGMNGFVEKPVRLDSLRNVLLAHLQSTNGERDGEQP